ncbi:MAG: ribonuclease PH [Candidatus Aminicenantes bacterium]|nr:ribonuclease PH [Candidatus Aminicenantes bacterium]
MRSSGRAPDELRPVKITPDCLDFAEGSALIEVGRTRVLAAATLEDKVPPFLKNTGSGWVTAEYAMLPRSTEKRTQRERMQGGRSQEIQRLIGRALRSVTDLPLLGERQIIVDCDVLQADGGTRTASISAACIALALCLKRMLDLRLIGRMPLKHLVAAVSVGVVAGELLLDLDYQEDSSAELDMNIVQTDRGQLVEVQASAEKAPFSRKTLAGLMQLADKGVTEIVQKQRDILIKKSRMFMAYGD